MIEPISVVQQFILLLNTEWSTSGSETWKSTTISHTCTYFKAEVSKFPPVLPFIYLNESIFIFHDLSSIQKDCEGAGLKYSKQDAQNMEKGLCFFSFKKFCINFLRQCADFGHYCIIYICKPKITFKNAFFKPN